MIYEYLTVNGERTRFPRVGESLPTGPIIVAEKVIGCGPGQFRESIVLALNPGNPNPYVTWRRCVSVETTATGEEKILDYCYAGYYTDKLDEAFKDFKAR